MSSSARYGATSGPSCRPRWGCPRLHAAALGETAVDVLHRWTLRLTQQEVSLFNTDSFLGEAIAEAVEAKAALSQMVSGFHALCSALGVSSTEALQLEQVNMWSTAHGCGYISELGEAYVHGACLLLLLSTSLCSLLFSGNEVGPRAGKALCEALRYSTSLTRLDLDDGSESYSSGRIESRGARALAGALAANRSLRMLNLKGDAGECNVGPTGCPIVCEALPASSVTSLDLSWNEADDSTLEAMASALRAGAPLQRLELSTGQMTPTGLVTLIDGMRASHFMVYLGLVGNAAMFGTWEDGTSGSSVEPTGEERRVDDNPAGVVDALCELLSSHQSLAKLNLEHNQLGEAQAEREAAASSHVQPGGHGAESLWQRRLQGRGGARRSALR